MKSKAGNRRLVGIGIVVFWLAMMGWLASRELGVQTLDSGNTSADRARRPTDTWMAVRMASGQRVGHVHMATRPETRDAVEGARMSLQAALRLELMGRATDLDLEGWVWRPFEDPGATFQFNVRSADYDFHVDGAVGDGRLAGEVTSAGETIPLDFPVEDTLLFGSGFGATLELPLLEVGEEYRIETFDPLTLSRGKARVRCVAKETLELSGESIETRHLTVDLGGLVSHAWIDDDGEVVRAETPVGLTLERSTAAEVARARLEVRGDAEEFLDLTAIKPTGERPFRGAATMTVQLSGMEPGTLGQLPVGDVQEALGDGRYRLTVPAEPDGEVVDSATPADFEAHLAADPFVQSGHPKIQDRASQILDEAGLADSADPWQRALAIHEWVYLRLDKEAVVSIPSALEVLENRRGDCNEHTVLFTALARAVDIPTRIVIGVVWSDDLDGFYYHAWPEVWVGDQWLWMDPTLGQPQADATHFALLRGGIEQWPQLLPYLGQLEMEILEIR